MFVAGKSTRVYPLTIDRPKPLLSLVGETILEHNIKQLYGLVSELILVVGYKKEVIIEYINKKKFAKKLKIKFVEQKEQLGTGHALLACERQIKDDNFLVMGGDDVFSSNDIKAIINKKLAILACKVKNPENYGVLEVKGTTLIKIHEKQNNPISNLVNTGLYLLNKDVFKILHTLKKSKRGEIELTDALSKLKLYVLTVKDYWFPVTFPWNLLETNVEMLKKIKDSRLGKVEKNVVIKGKVHIGSGTIIKSGSYIEGPVYIGDNCIIGPFAHIRKDTVICDGCVIGKTELYDILIMKNTTSKHSSYLAHGVVGENVNIGAGTITADYRHDGANHITLIKGQKTNTMRRKLGSFIGDNVNTGIGTLIYPGRKIWPGLGTLPGEIVKIDKEK